MPTTFNNYPVPGNEQITLDNCNKAVYKEVGRLIHNAAMNDDDYQSLRRNPQLKLKGAGVDEADIKNLQFYVVKAQPDQVYIAIPEVKDRNAFANQAAFDDYLTEIGLASIRACKR